MNIAIDARAYAWTGIGRYIRNLLREYALMKSDHQFIVLVPCGKRADFLRRVPLPKENFALVEVEGRYYSLAEQTTFLRELNNIKADIWHFTHFNIPLFFRRPYVVTIHDTTRFIFPGQKKQGLWQQMAYELVFANAVKNSVGVICVSKTTQAELRTLPIRLPATTQVIYEGVSEKFFAPVQVTNKAKVRALLNTSNQFLLYVGVWMTHKNLFRLLEAFAIIKKSRPDMKLVITGQAQEKYSDVKSYARKMGLVQDVIFPGFVSADLLPAMYAEAVCFCFPSLYEGFGLPPLEAAAVGTPVMTANVSSLPEIMGDAAEYVNPENVADIAVGTLRALEGSRRAQLVALGKVRAKQFTWADCAKQTLAMYERVK